MYADRIYATYRWVEETTGSEYKRADLSVTVEIVTGEVVDIIYQIFPIEHFGDSQWVEEYRKKADHYAKMISIQCYAIQFLQTKWLHLWKRLRKFPRNKHWKNWRR